MADTQRILHHIAELYAKPRANQDFDAAVLEMEEKLSARFDDYDAAFADRLTVDIIKAVDDFWRFKSDKTRPTLAQILAMENADTSKKERKDIDPESLEGLRRRILKCADELGDKWGKEARSRYLKAAASLWPDVDLSGHEWAEPAVLGCDKNIQTDYAAKLMSEDIRRGVNRHLLPVYVKAVRYIVEDKLSRVIPASRWANMDFGGRCREAERNNLFQGFDDVLVETCRKFYGKDYQFESADMLNSGSSGETFNGAANGLASHWRTEDVINF